MSKTKLLRLRPMTGRMPPPSIWCFIFLVVIALSTQSASALQGTVQTSSDSPIPNSYVSLLNSSFAFVADTTTQPDGSFDLDHSAVKGFLVVQPPSARHASGMQVFKHQPRIYQLEGQEDTVTLKLPLVVNLILKGHDENGKLLRWEDYEALGKVGGQFVYATGLDDIMIPAAIWPVHGTLTGAESGPREKSLPALLIEPGQLARINLLFWKTGYGKLLLPMDNAGKGYQLDKAGDALILEVNLELALTAVQQLQSQDDPPTITTQNANEILDQSLEQRDEQMFQAAQTNIPKIRQGTLNVILEGDSTDDVTISVEQISRDFLFGAYEGSPYNGAAWQHAHDAGFDLATVLLGWNWTQDPMLNRGTIDRTFGISALDKLGFQIKAHGVVWMQGYGIMPDFAYGLPHGELAARNLAHESDLLDLFAGSVDIWEAMNEPAATNEVDMPPYAMYSLLNESALHIFERGKPNLINSPHELSYGAKNFLHKIDGSLVQHYPRTYLDFLNEAQSKGVMDLIDLVGLQFYPGYHLNASFAQQEGPAYTPAYMVDTLNRYAKFGKPIHITEFSLPSTYASNWNSGYWKGPWTEALQADYAERIFTLAYANPHVGSITWWDIMDNKPAVISGGLVNRDGSPKESYSRIKDLLSQWWTNTEVQTKVGESTAIPAYSGRHHLVIQKGTDIISEAEVDIMGGWTKTLRIQMTD